MAAAAGKPRASFSQGEKDKDAIGIAPKAAAQQQCLRHQQASDGGAVLGTGGHGKSAEQNSDFAVLGGELGNAALKEEARWNGEKAGELPLTSSRRYPSSPQPIALPLVRLPLAARQMVAEVEGC